MPGFFTKIFSRQRKPVIGSPEPVVAMDSPLMPSTHPLHQDIDRLQREITALIKPDKLPDDATRNGLLDRLQVLRRQVEQAEKALRTLGTNSAENKRALDETMQRLVKQHEGLKVEAEVAVRKASGRDPYGRVVEAPAPKGAPAYTPIVRDGETGDLLPQDQIDEPLYADATDERSQRRWASAAEREQQREKKRHALLDALPCRIAPEAMADYHVTQTLGQGNFGSVQAMQNTQGDKLVVKRALPSEDGEAAFEREARAFAALPPHPAIVRCDGVAMVEGQPVLVLEHVQGRTAADTMQALRERMETGEIPASAYWNAVRYTLKQMAAAAAHLAQHGVVHNDLRFDNVMVDAATGQVKVIDLGLATESGQVPNAPVPIPFTAPEVLAAGPASGASDAYAVGSSAFQMGEHALYRFGLPQNQDGGLNAIIEQARQYAVEGGSPIEPMEREHFARQADKRPPKERFAARHAAARQQLDFIATSAAWNDPHASTQKGQALAQALAPLLDRARDADAGGRTDDALALLAEVEARLEDGARRAGVQLRQGSDYADFVQQLMAADPKDRLTLEQALQHPFLADVDESAAQALLGQVVSTQSPKPAQTDDAATQRAWLAHAGRELSRLKAYLPEDAPDRHAALERLQTLLDVSDGPMDPEVFERHRTRIERMIKAALDDRDERARMQQSITKLQPRVQAAIDRTPTLARELVQAVKQLNALLKPGGEMARAHQRLHELIVMLDGAAA